MKNDCEKMLRKWTTRFAINDCEILLQIQVNKPIHRPDIDLALPEARTSKDRWGWNCGDWILTLFLSIELLRTSGKTEGRPLHSSLHTKSSSTDVQHSKLGIFQIVEYNQKSSALPMGRVFFQSLAIYELLCQRRWIMCEKLQKIQ